MLDEAIARIRSKFEAELTAHEELYHPIDVERVRAEEWQVKRFLLDPNSSSEDEAFQMLCKSLRWKKSIGIHSMIDHYFPREFWELFGVEVYGRDKQDRLIQWETFCYQRLVPGDLPLSKQMVAHCLERVDRLSGETGFILVVDTTNSSIANVDFDLIKFKIGAIQHYPLTLKAVYIVNLPWCLTPLTKVLEMLLTPQLRTLVRYVTPDMLANLIEPINIPISLGGRREVHDFPKDARPMSDLFYFKDEFVDAFYKTFNLKRKPKNCRCANDERKCPTNYYHSNIGISHITRTQSQSSSDSSSSVASSASTRSESRGSFASSTTEYASPLSSMDMSDIVLDDIALDNDIFTLDDMNLFDNIDIDQSLLDNLSLLDEDSLYEYLKADYTSDPLRNCDSFSSNSNKRSQTEHYAFDHIIDDDDWMDANTEVDSDNFLAESSEHI